MIISVPFGLSRLSVNGLLRAYEDVRPIYHHRFRLPPRARAAEFKWCGTFGSFAFYFNVDEISATIRPPTATSNSILTPTPFPHRSTSPVCTLVPAITPGVDSLPYPLAPRR